MIDYLIVGQGICGSLLAWKLKKRGKSVLVVDAGHERASSRVAAGMLNPIPGQRLSMAWQLANCLPTLRQTYRELEDAFQQAFLHKRPILRIVSTEREKAYLQERIQDPRYQPYLHINLDSLPEGLLIPAESIPFLITEGGQLDIPSLIQCLRRWLAEQESLCEEIFLHRDLIPNPNGAQWKDWHFSQVVFCEGWQVIHNPWFAHLPFDPVRGAILTLTPPPDTIPPWILNCGQWLLPTADGRLKAGSTYERNHLEVGVCTEADIDTICTSLERHWKPPLREHIVSGEYGIRPCTRSNRPVLGRHPEHPRLAIFNGLGSKGSLFAPWLADLLIEHLENQVPLPPDVSLKAKPHQEKQQSGP